MIFTQFHNKMKHSVIGRARMLYQVYAQLFIKNIHNYFQKSYLTKFIRKSGTYNDFKISLILQ